MSADAYHTVLRDLRQHRDELNLLIATLERHAPSPNLTPPHPAPTEGANGPRVSLRDAAYDLLTDVGHPLAPKDILAQLRDGGFEPNARHPAEALRSALRRDSRFRKAEPRGRWGLAHWFDSDLDGEHGITRPLDPKVVE